MPNSFRLLLAGQPAPAELLLQMSMLEVEENLDLPGAFQLQLPISRTSDGDLTFVNDTGLQPMSNVAVVATAEGQPPECIFDGLVLSHRVHLGQGLAGSTLTVWGQDASWLMNFEEKVREWVDVTDATVANTIFKEYGVNPASQNLDADSPGHTEDGHTLMQRGTDIQFLRTLARRNGKFARVVCHETPGERTGYFSRPQLDGTVAATLTMGDPEKWNTTSLDLEWDVTRASAVLARQAVFTDPAPEGVSGDSDDSGLPLLDERGLKDFSGQIMQVMLTTPADDAGQLTHRAQALLADAGWFVRCEAETDVARIKKVLRAGDIVAVEAIGSVHSGKYLVWSVRHTIRSDSHSMRITLVRNAVGPEPQAAGGGFLGAL